MLLKNMARNTAKETQIVLQMHSREQKNMCIFQARGGVLELAALLGVQASAEMF